MPAKTASRRIIATAFALAAATLGVVGAALGDVITGDAVNQVVSGTDPVNASVSKEAGTSGAGKFALTSPNSPAGDENGCNAGTSATKPPVVLAVSSNKSWLTLTQSTISLTNCDTGTLSDGLQNAATVNYALSSSAPAGETATVTATYQSGGVAGGTYTSGSFSVTATAAANTAPTTPGTPALTVGSSTPNKGLFGLGWTASTDSEANAITYRLEHRDANDASYSLVTGAGGLLTNAFAFVSGSPETEGTWTYRVRASDGTLTSAFSGDSTTIKADRSAPSAPTAGFDRSPEDASGNWFKDTVTVSYSGSADPALADGSAGSGVASHGAQQVFNTSGTHGYSGKATDNAGNESTATTGNVKVDATDPSVLIDSGCPTGLVARNSTHNLAVSASDAQSGLVSDPTGNVALDTSAAGEQTKTINVSDKVGHTDSVGCTYTVNSAPGAPGTPVVSASPTRGAFTVSWDAATDTDGNLDHYVLKHKDANDVAYSNVGNVAAGPNPSHEFTSGSPESEGTWTYKVIAVDELDEQGTESGASNAAKVDRSGPSAPSADADRSPEDATGSWFKDTVTITYSGSTDPDLADGSAGTGVDSYTAPEVFSTTGTHNYSGKATDDVGNDSTSTTGSVKVDATDPTVSITAGCPTGLVARNSTQNLTVSAGDAHSGLVSDPSGSVALDTSTPGEQTKTVNVTDKVGHTDSAACTYTVNSAPGKPGKPTVSATPSQGAFTVSWTAATDADSNLDHYLLEHKDANDAAYSTVGTVAAGPNPQHEFTAASPEAQGTWTYRVTAVDELEESGDASDASDPAKVDRGAPSAPSAATTPASPDYGDWFKDTVTVGYSGSTDPALPDGSAGSGVASHSANQLFNTSGTHNYSGTATDNAGNTSTATTGSVKVDALKPSVIITGCPTGPVEVGSSQSVTVAAADGHSGLVTDPSGSRALDTSSIGEKTLTVPVADNVGHTESAACTYDVEYDWTGFFRPVDTGGVLNSVKAGSAVPVKFSLGGYQGMNVLEPGFPSWGPMSCNSTADVDPVEQTVTAGHSSLSYDATTGQYTYVWKTDKNWTGCRQLVVKLADDSFHRANFKFTR